MWAYRTIAELNDSRTGTEAQETSQQAWIPPSGTLGELVRAMAVRPVESVANAGGSPGSFSAALRGEFVCVIAEIKRSSPSRGAIRPSLDAARQASTFAAGGASAISVLTEPSRFGGSIADIGRVSGVTNLPILKKDFHVSPKHLHQAKNLGASAALLIVRAISPETLRECMQAAADIGIEVLIEVHRESELELALELGAKIVGVNARNLETLEMNPKVHAELIPRIPVGVIAIAESGMSTCDDVQRAADLGADAVLIGSSLSQSDDPAGLLQSLTTVKRRDDVRTN